MTMEELRQTFPECYAHARELVATWRANGETHAKASVPDYVKHLRRATHTANPHLLKLNDMELLAVQNTLLGSD